MTEQELILSVKKGDRNAFGKAFADGCGKVASACSCDVSPIAKAFEAAAGDGIQMYYPDNHHQSQYGSYLKACVNYLMIYGEAFNEDASDCGLRNRVVSASAPWMAAEQSAGSKVETFERAMLPECLQGILGACRRKAAGWRFERRDADLIETYQENEGADGYLLDDSQEFMLLLLHFC